MASINGHQKTGGGIWFFGVDGYDEASFAKLKAISPLYAVHKGMPPFLEIHGTRDDQVPYEQSTLMCEAMHKVGARCDIITVEAGGHGMGSWKDAGPAALQGRNGRMAEEDPRASLVRNSQLFDSSPMHEQSGVRGA